MAKQKLQRQMPTPILTYETPFPQYPFEPEIIPHFKQSRAEELAEAIPPMFPIPGRQRIIPTLTQEVKDRGYKNFTIDLSTAHTDAPLGLRALGVIATSMTIIRADDTFDYKLNSPSNDATPAEKGLEEDQFEIEEIYITNSASSGKKAIIRVIWNPRLIRPM